MHYINQEKPVVLVLSGHDPSGGAGIQADIESIAANGCHSASIITTLTTQNSKFISKVTPQDPGTLKEQIHLIISDMEIASCKIGVIGDMELVEVIVEEISDKDFPVVLDPVIQSSSNHLLADIDTQKKIMEILIPLVTVITPNSLEARELASTENLNKAAEKLLNTGCNNVLITGTHENIDPIINTLYCDDGSINSFESNRLPGSYHGSGCTLSSAIAANLANRTDLKQSVEKSLCYTWNCLKNASTSKSGIKIPDRIHWCMNNFENHD